MKKDISFRNKFFLSMSVLTFSATQIILFTLFPYLAVTLSISLANVILYFSLGTLLFLIGSPFWADQSDKLGRNLVINIGLTGLAISFALIVFLIEFHRELGNTWNLSLLIMSRIIYGLFASAIVPVSQLARKDMVRSNEHLSAMLSHSLSLSLGRSLGPLLILLFAAHISDLLYVFSFTPLILIFFGSKSSVRVAKESDSLTSRWLDSLSAIKLPLLVTVLFTLYVGILHSSLGHTIEHLFHVKGLDTTRFVAEILLVGSLVMSSSQIIGKIFLKNNFRAGITAGLIVLSIGAILLAFTTERHELWIAIALISSGIALIQPSHLAIVHQLFPEDKAGQKIGLLSSGNTIGYALGGGLTALLLEFEIHKLSLVVIFFLILSAATNILRVRQC